MCPDPSVLSGCPAEFEYTEEEFRLVYGAFSALTLLAGQQKGHPSGLQRTEWWGTDVVICLKQRADLHMAQLMALPPTVSCFSKIQIGFTFLVLSHPGKSRTKKQLNGCVFR